MSDAPLYKHPKPLSPCAGSVWNRLVAVAVMTVVLVFVGSGLGGGLASADVAEGGTTFSSVAFQLPQTPLNELVDVQPRVAVLASFQEPSLTQSNERVVQEYRVQSGDTLWEIAEQQLGSGMRWQEIYQVNLEVIGPDPNLIRVGVLLQGIQSPQQFQGQP